MSLLESLTSLFAPDDCLGCGREGSLLCESCVCSMPVPIGRCFDCYKHVSGAICLDCLARSRLTSLTVVAAYEGVARGLVARLKFGGNQAAARIMARCMSDHVNVPLNSVITHVPATAPHIRERGYDQAQLVAKTLGRLQGLRSVSILRRSGSAHQLGANRRQRLLQMQSSLRVAHMVDLKGAHVTLVDDVLTTGATLRAATATLLAAGARQVDAVVFAQAPRPDP